MKINSNPEDLQKSGVYQITNLITGKIYIGSTQMSFIKRLSHHTNRLRCNKHKNTYLQSSFNKHGEDNFEFSILEVCHKINCEIREQYYIDSTNCLDKNVGYNINPLSTGVNFTQETIEKRRQTMLKRYANGELDHLRGAGGRKKGSKLDNTDHLKVKKTITEKVILSREKRIEDVREKLPKVFVYDNNKNFLMEFRSIPDLIEYSLKDNDLPIKSRFPNGREFNGKIQPPKALREPNIHMSLKHGTIYKNLYFSYTPLHEVIRVEKLDKNGEG